MIDTEAIKAEFVKIARELTYVRPLSTNAKSGLKNVYKSRPDDTDKPDYPFIVLDLLSIDQTDAWELNKRADPITGDYIVDTNYDLLLSYTVYGDQAMTIANQLEGYFRLNRVLDTLCENTNGGNLVQTFPVQSIPQELANKFVDAASFDLIFTVTDTITDTETGTIDEINLTGELNRIEDDPSPLPIIINETF